MLNVGRVMLIPIMTFAFYAAILLNIPVFRETITFIYLTFIPGFALLRLLRLKKTSLLETFLFSVGLSIAFLMLFGLLANQFYALLGFSQPLSIIPLAISISAATLIVFLIGNRLDL